MKIALITLALLMMLYVISRNIEKSSIFFPTKTVEMTPAAVGLRHEDVHFTTSDGVTLHGWYVPRTGAGQHVVLFFHGNAGNISHRLEKIAFFSRLGMDVFIVDYRGYGKSEGTPTEKGLYRDAEGAYAYLTAERGHAAESIIAFGESLGGVIAVHLASVRPVTALVTVNTFTSVRDMTRRLYPFLPTFFVRARLDALSKIRGVDCPKLIIHSREDDIVPFELGEKLFAAAREPKTFLEIHGNHNEAFYDSMDITWKGITEFLGGASQ